MKRYVLIAGVNGAGKSTLYQTLESLQSMPRLNIAEIVREFGDWKNPNDVMKPGRIAVGMIKEHFEKGQSFNQETTLCGKSILENIKYAKQLGYEIELHYVGIDSAELAKERIAYRVAHGGHGIPDKDVDRRFVESRDQLKKFCRYVIWQFCMITQRTFIGLPFINPDIWRFCLKNSRTGIQSKSSAG